jgi:hypothetical protein
LNPGTGKIESPSASAKPAIFRRERLVGKVRHASPREKRELAIKLVARIDIFDFLRGFIRHECPAGFEQRDYKVKIFPKSP